MPSPRVAMFQRYVGANVRRLRKRDSRTQEALAEVAGIDVRYLRLIERGEMNMTLAVLVELATALDVDPAKLMQPAVLEAARPGRPRKASVAVRKSHRGAVQK